MVGFWEGPLPGCTLSFSHVLMWQKGVSKLSPEVCLIWTLITSQRPHLLILSLAFRDWAYEFSGDTNIQSITVCLLGYICIIANVLGTVDHVEAAKKLLCIGEVKPKPDGLY